MTNALVVAAGEQLDDTVQLRSVIGLCLAERLQVGFDLVQAHPLSKGAATECAHVFADVIDHRVDGVDVGIKLGDLAFDLGHPRRLAVTEEGT